MAEVAGQATLIARDPNIINTAGRLTVSLPIFNTSAGSISDVTVTNIKLGSAKRLEPTTLPYRIGNANSSTVLYATAIFESPKSTTQQLIIVSGLYKISGTSSIVRFSLSRSFVIPAPVKNPITELKATLTAKNTSTAWTYTLVNKEGASSTMYISSFALDLVSPITSASAPAGWTIDTDKSSYILWYQPKTPASKTDLIAPGKSLSGFKIVGRTSLSEGTAYTIGSINIKSGKPGLKKFATVSSPQKLK